MRGNVRANLDLAEVQLPARFKGCKDDATAGGGVTQYRCAYSTYPLEKLFSKKFATSGSRAVRFVKLWRWTSADQNFVANLISGKKLKPEKAAEQWVKANPGKVNAWLK